MEWSLLRNFIEDNARFALTDRLEIHLDHVRMPVGNGRVKTKGRSLDVLSAIKRSIVVVKAAFLCLTHAIIIAIARVHNDPKYKPYSNGRCMEEPVEELLNASGVDLSNGGDIEELQQYLSDYKIIVLDDLHPDRVMFSENYLLTKKLY